MYKNSNTDKNCMIQKMGCKKRIVSLFFFLFTISNILLAQSKSINGTVKDREDYPLTGVSVAVKGSTKGTITDMEGNYSLQNINGNDILVFSYLGYKTQEITADNRTVINVTMSEDAIDLGQEVVVVGYGTQKKVNLTGAVSAVKVDEAISGRSIANASTALQGLVPGLTVVQGSGMAGNNAADIFIRGIGTINNASPLIVVDDMPDVDINRLNMDDIESISVLKDATASSVYGSRAANGVILIKTKSGKGMDKTKITFSGSYAWENPIKSYNFLTDYAKSLEVQRLSQAGINLSESSQIYKKGTIDEWMAMSMIDGKRFPNTDWWDIIMQKGSLQNYNVSATGGNDKSNFYASIGYLKQEGLQINNNYDRYNARFNFDYKMFKNVNLGFRMDGNWSNYQYALANGFTSVGDNYNMDMQSAIAGIYPYDPILDVYGGVMAIGEDPTAFNPLEYFTNRLKKEDRQELNGSFYIDWSPFKGLVARIDYNLRYYNQFKKEADKPNQAYNFQKGEYMPNKWYVSEDAPVKDESKSGYKTLLNARLNYNAKIARNHDLGLMFVYSEEYWYDRALSAWRNDRIHPDLSEIDAALTSKYGNGGNSSTEGLRSYIGRVNYSAFDKYLLELNFRVDGSSKFQPGHQYGFFPSAAVGWRFSEEDFIKPSVEGWMTNGKLRLSYGALGNNSVVGRTEQQELLNHNNYMLGTDIVKGLVYRKMLNPDLTWEKTIVFNAGLDFGFLNNRLTAELDYYDRLTSDMIQYSQMSIFLTGAYDAPRENIGDLRNRGLEANITWRDKIRDFNYSVNFNISYNRSRLEKWSEYLGPGSSYNGNLTFIDMPYNYGYTYLDRGIAQSYAEIYKNALQWINPGDIIREDVNGDGIIDSKDMVADAGYQRGMPTTNFGLNIQMSWKGFDASMLFQGTYGRKDYWMNQFMVLSNIGSRYAATGEHIDNPWSYDNRGGSWPRIGGSLSNTGNTQFWLDNLAYLRMKNLMIGYTIPSEWSRKFFVDTLRIYGSTENLFTITRYRGLDPEKTNRGDMYPLTRSFTIGINVGF